MRFLATIVLVLVVSAVRVSSVIYLNERNGFVESPGYPHPYNNNENQTWIITVAPGYQVMLEFTVFDLEDSYDAELGGYCAYDYVQIEGAGNIQRLCGKGNISPHFIPQNGHRFLSEGNTMSIKFVSDYSNEDPRPVGFWARYYANDRDECKELDILVQSRTEDWDQVIFCNHFCVNVPGTYYCSCRIGFELNANLHTCSAVCSNQHLSEESGIITSPDYPASYSKLTECDWTIEVRNGHSLNFYFSNPFDIEDHFNYTGCPYDWLKISYGDQQQTLCGNQVPNNEQVIQTNKRSARIVFHTDYAIEKAGFKITYNTTRVRCPVPRQVPDNGLIVNSTLTTNYSDHYEFEDNIQFACNLGYFLLGSDIIHCQANGTWSSALPKCQIKSCGNPVELHSIPHATLSDSLAYTYGSTVNVSCNSWYEMVSGATNWICNERKQWVPTGKITGIPQCQPVCGLKGRIQSLEKQIALGKDARRGEWPWMAFIDLTGRGLNSPRFCGGSLVNEKYVITAAHCLKHSYADDVFVYLGVHDRSKRNDTHIQKFAVVKFMTPDQYEPQSFEHDIAVIQLNGKTTINQWVRPICLPRTNSQRFLPERALTDNPNFQRRAVISGWGRTEQNDQPARILQMTRLPMVNRHECKLYYAQHNYEITGNMFCAGFTETKAGKSARRDACVGDSGGPLSFNLAGKWYLNGIVSFGLNSETECGGTYGVYTNVEKYLAWITTYIHLP